MDSYLKSVLLIFIVAFTCFSQSKVPSPNPCDCNLKGILYVPDSVVTNILAKPNGKILKSIKLKIDDERIVFDIIGHRSGWLNVLYDYTDSSKIGWVNGDLVGLWLMRPSTPLYKKANINSQIIAYISQFYEGEKSDHPVLVIGCQGSWAFVKAKDKDGKIVKGWLAPEDQCANPYTSCAP